MPQNCFKVQDVFVLIGVGCVPVGEVISGTISVGMKTKINNKEATVEFIEQKHKRLYQATEGMNIGLKLSGSGISKEDIKRGDVLYFE